MRKTTMVTVAAFALAAAIAAGCSATQPGGDPGMTPGEQCQLLQAGAAAAETAVLLAKIKDDAARTAVFATLDGVRAGAADYCDAVARGDAADGLRSFLTGFYAALASLNAQLREVQATPATSSGGSPGFRRALFYYDAGPRGDPLAA